MLLGHFLLHITGGDNGTTAFYLEWSGFIGQLSLISGIILYFRKHNCHVKHCPRIGKHSVANGKYVVCKNHHPGIKKGDITHQCVKDDHEEYNKSR